MDDTTTKDDDLEDLGLILDDEPYKPNLIFRVREWLRWGGPIWVNRLYNRTRDAWWWLLHRVVPRHRYHVVRTGLKPSYYDPDWRITFAVFQIVAEFKHHVDGLICWDHDPGHELAWKAICAATAWWEGGAKQHILDGDLSLDAEASLDAELASHFAAIGHALPYMWYP